MAKRATNMDKPITVHYGDVWTDIDVLHVADGKAETETIHIPNVTVASNATANSITAVLDKAGYKREGMTGYIYLDGAVNVSRGETFHIWPETVMNVGSVIRPNVDESQLVTVRASNSSVAFWVRCADGEHKCYEFEFSGARVPYREYCKAAEDVANEQDGLPLVLTNSLAQCAAAPVTYYATIEQLRPYAMSDKEFAAALRKSGASDMA